MANTFQGHFPDKDTGEDKFIRVSEVGRFPANGYELYDMAGNGFRCVKDVLLAVSQ
jgi:sulfatase modifying factor 1